MNNKDKIIRDLLEVVRRLMDEYRPDPAHDEHYYPTWALADAVVDNALNELPFIVQDSNASL